MPSFGFEVVSVGIQTIPKLHATNVGEPQSQKCVRGPTPHVVVMNLWKLLFSFCLA